MLETPFHQSERDDKEKIQHKYKPHELAPQVEGLRTSNKMSQERRNEFQLGGAREERCIIREAVSP
jgi:hypothetical protein